MDEVKEELEKEIDAIAKDTYAAIIEANKGILKGAVENLHVGDRFVIYKDDAGEWRWRRMAGNNRVIACGGEGYKKLSHCLKMLRRCNGYFEYDYLTIEE